MSMEYKTLLVEAAESVQDSANARGTSNKAVSRFALVAAERIELQAAIIASLERDLAEVRELLGLPMP